MELIRIFVLLLMKPTHWKGLFFGLPENDIITTGEQSKDLSPVSAK